MSDAASPGVSTARKPLAMGYPSRLEYTALETMILWFAASTPSAAY